MLEEEAVGVSAVTLRWPGVAGAAAYELEMAPGEAEDGRASDFAAVYRGWG